MTHHSTTVIRNSGREHRFRAGAEKCEPAAHAVPHDKETAAIEVPPPKRVIRSCGDFPDNLGVLEEFLAIVQRHLLRTVVVEIWHDREVPSCRKLRHVMGGASIHPA